MNVGKNQNRMPIIIRVIPRSRSWRLSCCLGRSILLYIQRPRPICRYVCLSIVEKKELTIKITPRIIKKSASEKISIVYILENREGGKPFMIRKHIMLYSRVTAKTFPVKASSPWMAFIKSFGFSIMKHGCWLICVVTYNPMLLNSLWRLPGEKRKIIWRCVCMMLTFLFSRWCVEKSSSAFICCLGEGSSG